LDGPERDDRWPAGAGLRRGAVELEAVNFRLEVAGRQVAVGVYGERRVSVPEDFLDHSDGNPGLE